MSMHSLHSERGSNRRDACESKRARSDEGTRMLLVVLLAFVEMDRLDGVAPKRELFEMRLPDVHLFRAQFRSAAIDHQPIQRGEGDGFGFDAEPISETRDGV